MPLLCIMTFMEPALFDELDRMLPGASPAAALDFLIGEFRRRGEYALLFEAKLMKRRAELGVPLIQTAPLPEDKRAAYDETVIATARETGALFLAEGNIERAWPYFRAIGEHGPVRDAIGKYGPGEDDDPEGIIDIAYQQGVYPAKGLALILSRHGMCRAITVFGMYGSATEREECAVLLIANLYQELRDNLKGVVERHEGERPASESIAELIGGREWLFGEYDYYIDTSHLSSVIQYAADITDRTALGQIRELCCYGRRLSVNFRIQGHPPFENIYEDYDAYAAALLGDGTEDAIAHFRRKVEESDVEETLAAQVLVQLLLKLNRESEAMELALERLAHKAPNEISCPPAMHLCRMAGDYEALRRLAREKGDVLSYAAAALESRG
ncbi:MAG: hypothetical protein JNK48_08125 [Bryobacterales bacterium]|nr:hypothetical protein [Bryobacterales bacterium]